MATETTTLVQTLSTLSLHSAAGGPPRDEKEKEQKAPARDEEPYRYAALLPVFNNDQYPPLEPFDHVDPGFRALKHANPRSFLDGATDIVELTPNLGTEVHGVNLAKLTSDERDQLALEVSQYSLRSVSHVSATWRAEAHCLSE